MLRNWKCHLLLNNRIRYISNKQPVSKSQDSGARTKKYLIADTRSKILALQVKDCLNFSEDEALRFADKNKLLWKVSKLRINKTIEFLIRRNVSTKTIIENPWIMAMPIDELIVKLESIEKLVPREQINDFVPLIRIATKQFFKTIQTMQSDDEKILDGNRIYYMSSRLEVDPSLVSKYFASHLFMFNLSAKKFQENLQIMIDFGITPMSILRDLWSFEHASVKIKMRLEKFQSAGTPVLRPWMVRCTEENLNKALKLSEERKRLLSDQTLVGYLSERLNSEEELMENLVNKHKFLQKICIKKIKDVLDYLLIQEKFDPNAVTRSINIFAHSLDKTKKRFAELKELGNPPSSLVILCYAQSEYLKYLKKCKSSRDAEIIPA